MLKFLLKNYWTKLASLIILGTIFYTISIQEKWKQPNAVISSDVKGYYAYLPALFINDDLKFEDMSVYVNPIDGSDVWVIRDTVTHVNFIKYSCGMAILYSPFFFWADATAASSGSEADGFSEQYKYALVIGSFVYLIIGIFFLSKFLLLHFKDHVTSIVLLLLYLATNIYHYETSSLTFSHGYSIMVISIFFYCSALWLKKPKWHLAIAIGLSAGLMSLIRPVDIIFLLFPILYKIDNLAFIKERIYFILKQRWQLFVMMLLFIVVWVPQFTYNYYIFGSIFMYSYTGESFFFGHPQLLDTVFSFRNGWLVYSPVMIFSLLGFVVIWKRHKELRILLISVFVIYWYVISSWWCWWYMGFGNRAFINLYPILSLTLGAFITYIFDKRWFVSLSFSILMLPLIALNLFQSYQFDNGFIHWGAMTKDAYLDVFGQTHNSQMYPTLLRYPELKLAHEGIDAIHDPIRKTIYEEIHDFENPQEINTSFSSYRILSNGHKSNNSIYVDCNEFSLNYPIITHYSKKKHATRLYVSAWIKSDLEISMVTTVSDANVFYNGTALVVEEIDGWKKMELHAYMVQNIEFDTINFYFWNPKEAPFQVDDLQIKWIEETFEIKVK